MQQHKEAADFEDQINARNIQIKVENAIKKVAPWKAPGMDAIPAAAQKIFPSAKEYAIKTITFIIQGSRNMSEIKVRARVTLIHKDGDPADPSHYRPISVSHSEYKNLTADLAEMIEQNLMPWMIPRE